MIRIDYKKLVIVFSLTCLVIALLIYILYKSMSLSNYAKLDSCLRASVSKNVLCSQVKDYVSLKNISQDVVQPIITSEDDKFYFHDGFDWKEFRASVTANLRAFSFVRGGSTITQQLVKNIYLSQEKSITRKIKEAILASQIEEEYSKSLILEKYLNAIEFGPNIWGIKKAAHHYFNKSPKNLEILEGVYLAVLLPSPKRYSKSFDNKKLTPYLKRRMKTILYWLKRKKYLDKIDYDIALENIKFFPWDNKPIFDADHYNFHSDLNFEIDDDNSLNFEKKTLTESLDSSSESSQKTDDMQNEFEEKNDNEANSNEVNIETIEVNSNSNSLNKKEDEESISSDEPGMMSGDVEIDFESVDESKKQSTD